MSHVSKRYWPTWWTSLVHSLEQQNYSIALIKVVGKEVKHNVGADPCKGDLDDGRVVIHQSLDTKVYQEGVADHVDCKGQESA